MNNLPPDNRKPPVPDQTFINAVLGGFGLIASFILKAIWDDIKSLQRDDTSLRQQMSNLNLLVAGSYVKREDLESLTHALFSKLDKIEDKLDKKADKP